jgi:hypothetical protein
MTRCDLAPATETFRNENRLDGDYCPQGASRLLSQRLVDELVNMSIEEALPLARAFGHYLNLTSIAELHHKCGPFAHVLVIAVLALTRSRAPGCAELARRRKGQSHATRCSSASSRKAWKPRSCSKRSPAR